MRYDYSKNDETLEQLIGALSPAEERKAVRLIQDMKREEEDDTGQLHKKWILAMILPVFKKYAENTQSVLEVETEDKKIYVLLKNRGGFEIGNPMELQRMKTVVIMSDYIRFDTDGGWQRLALEYSVQKEQ